MVTLEAASTVYQIGASAGQVWNLLETSGPQNITAVVKEIDAPRDQVMQAIGWLAREEKITIEEQARSRVVSLVG